MASRKSKQKSGLLASAVTTFPFRGNPFRVTQTTSGTGGITSVESQASVSHVNSIALDPYTIGGRLNAMAALFTEYRFTRFKLTYVPDGTTSSGVLENVTGGTTSPTYAARSFAMGLATDPALSTLSFAQIIEMGGKPTNTTRGLSFNIKGGVLNTWRYTSTTLPYSSTTTIDLRLVAPLKLYFAYFNSSTTAGASFGEILIDATVQFRGAVGIAQPIGSFNFKEDEKKDENVDLVSSYILMKKPKK